jgi:integrase
LKEILDYAYAYDYELYIQLVIVGFTGCRAGECVSLKKDNIEPFRLFFMTGIVPNARKTSKDNPYYFVFSKRIGLILSRYMLYHKSKYNDTKWLFPQKKDHSKHNTVRRLQKLCERMRDHFGYPIKTHIFRKSLNTARANECNTDLEKREYLLNQAVTSTNANYYTKYTIERRIEIYLENYPETYQKLETVLQM